MTSTLALKLWEIIYFNLMGDSLSCWHISYNFVCHKIKLSLGFFINRTLLFQAIWSLCRRPVNFWARSLSEDPLWIVSIHLFYYLLCISSLLWRSQEAGPHGQGLSETLSDRLNRLCSLWTLSTMAWNTHTWKTSNSSAWWEFWEDGEVEKSVNYET